GQGIDAVEGDPGDGPVIAVRAPEVVRAVRVHRDHEIGAPPSDLARDVAPEVARVLDLAVGIAEELDADNAERAGGVALLFLADARQPFGGHRTVAGALVAVGHDDVRDLAAISHE